MNLILKELYKISWAIKKITGYKRPEKLATVTKNFTPTNDKKIVYSIVCHVNANQVIRLIKNIYHHNNLYYLVLDLKTPKSFHRILREYSNNYDNLYLINRDVEWGKWSQVQVVLDVIENALKIDTKWTHFINLSGQDFPLKKQEDIIKELSNKVDSIFLEGRHFPPENEKSGQLFSTRKWKEKDKNQPRLDLLYPKIKFHKGSQWMILSRSFCDYTINSEFSKQAQEIFKEAYIPDETFFITLGSNSELANKIIWENKRFIKWQQGSAHPNIITTDYLPQLTTGDFYFARKFDSRIDENVVDKLERILES